MRGGSSVVVVVERKEHRNPKVGVDLLSLLLYSLIYISQGGSVLCHVNADCALLSPSPQNSDGTAEKHMLLAFGETGCVNKLRDLGFPGDYGSLGEEFETGEVS